MVFVSLGDSAVEYWCTPLNVVHNSLCVNHILEVEALEFNKTFVEACRGGRLGAINRLQVEAWACQEVLIEIWMGVVRMRLDSRSWKQGVGRHRTARLAESIPGKGTIEAFIRHDVNVATRLRNEPVKNAKVSREFPVSIYNLRFQRFDWGFCGFVGR